MILALLPKDGLTATSSLKNIPPISVYVVLVSGDGGYSNEAALGIATEALYWLGVQTNLKLHISGFEERVGEPVNIDDTSRQDELFMYEGEYEQVKRRDIYNQEFGHRKRISADYVLVITGPLIDSEGGFWLGGYDGEICKFQADGGNLYGDRVALVNIEPINQAGFDRRKESIVAIEHEMLHALGASHVYGTTTVMDPAAMAYAELYGPGLMPISDINRQQLRQCFLSPRGQRWIRTRR